MEILVETASNGTRSQPARVSGSDKILHARSSCRQLPALANFQLSQVVAVSSGSDLPLATSCSIFKLPGASCLGRVQHFPVFSDSLMLQAAISDVRSFQLLKAAAVSSCEKLPNATKLQREIVAV
jgi:hypothetical protein